MKLKIYSADDEKGAMMRRKIHKLSVIGCLLCAVACKNQAGSGSNSETLNAGTPPTSSADGNEKTLTDAQEFYEIAKASYVKKMRTLGPTALSDAEQRFLEKFQVNPESSGQVMQFVETMFEVLESGRYGFKLKAIPVKTQVSRSAPEGLTDFEVKKFYELIKMDYFKKVTKRPAPEMDQREKDFFERVEKKSTEKYDYQNDYLLIASDLFDTIEGL